MLTDVMGDHVDLSFGTPQQVGPFVTAGKLKAFGVTQENKMPEFPQADSFVKLYGPKLEILFWENIRRRCASGARQSSTPSGRSSPTSTLSPLADSGRLRNQLI
jgi:Tripartite tricarboxylate transporter family receptor